MKVKNHATICITLKKFSFRLFSVVNIHHNSSSLTMYNWLQVLITSNHVIYLGLKPSPVKASHLTLPKHSDGSSGMNMESPLHVQSMDQVNSPPPSKKHDNDTQITQQLAKKESHENEESSLQWKQLATFVDRIFFIVHVVVIAVVLFVFRLYIEPY